MAVRRVFWVVVVALAAVLWADRASAQLFENLEAFAQRLRSGDPSRATDWAFGQSGPKGIATADFDQDGAPDLAVSNIDGTVTVYLGRPGGRFSEAQHLDTGTPSLRGIVAADLTGDGRADIAAAAPFAARLAVFSGEAGGRFGAAAQMETWNYARNLAAGDFDGDGITDLAVGGAGLGLRHYRGQGNGVFQTAAELAELNTPAYRGAKPVYSLKALRRPGASRDILLATHADARSLWVLAAGPSGGLAVQGRVDGVYDVYSLDAAPLAAPASSARPDLVTAHRNRGVIEVRRGTDLPNVFEPAVQQEIAIPGGPRAVAIADLDLDGWNDVVVVVRNLDRVLTLRNEFGRLVPVSEMPSGRSPREVVAGDFNRDGRPDVAVINRGSSDVSILTSHTGQAGFGALDQLYLVDGEVADLEVADLDRDGRDDVVQLHRASSDLSVRLAQPGGLLGEPVFYPMGMRPSALRVLDVDGDGLLDAVTANIGRDAEAGSISARLGNGAGGFGEERLAPLPPESSGRLFALEAADLDGDGLKDLAAGFFDCRIVLFRNLGSGRFESVLVDFFTYEARTMASGDFDQDGDVDIAGAGYAGDVVVLENQGDMLAGAALHREDYPSPSEGKFGTMDLRVTDVNSDGDLDLVVGSGRGAMVYLGAEGMLFTLASETLPGTDFPVSSVALGDFDGDGGEDMAAACQILSCVTILTRGADGLSFVPALSIDVPAGRLVASGDLDGDGHADLVGTGETLWTALSSRRAAPSGPPVLVADRQPIDHPVINELLALNNAFPLGLDGGRTADWVELFNGAPAAVSLAGWRLTLSALDDAPGEAPRVFTLPQDASLAAAGHRVVVFSNTQRSPYHTGFKLPGAGGTVTLLGAGGEVVDRVDYPPQRENVSYARYRDGLASFVFNNYPNAAAANMDNGPVPPLLSLDGAWSAATAGGGLRPPAPGEPIRFFARGEDDVGIVSASVLWERLDAPEPERRRVVLYDDGMHSDGAMQDGLFSGVIEPGLPAGAEIRFQVEVTDLSDNVLVLPDGDATYGDGEGGEFYSLAVGTGPRSLEISEVVALNENGLRDESGGTPDWVEVENCGTEPASLEGVLLARSITAVEEAFAFPAGLTLAPGEQLVVFCDGAAAQGSLHAPFALDAGGDEVVLMGTTARGAREVLDAVSFGAESFGAAAADTAYARQGCGGDFRSAAPTPGADNAARHVARGDADGNGRLELTDPIAVLNHLFQGRRLACPEAARVNSDGTLDLSDAIYLLAYLFTGGPEPQGGPAECP
jgi:hypothetical protein